MCPIIDNDASLLRSIVGHANVKRAHDYFSIWTVEAPEGEEKSVAGKVGVFIKLVMEEFPYSLSSNLKNLDNCRAVSDKFCMMSPGFDFEDYFSASMDGTNILYASIAPLPDTAEDILNPDKIEKLFTENDVAFVILTNGEENKFHFGFNPESKFFEKQAIWRGSYLHELYPDLAGYLGIWFGGLNRNTFNSESEIAFFLSHGTTPEFRDKFIAQIERLVTELPLPREQIEKIASRDLNSDEIAVKWLKDIRHEFQLRSSYEEDAARVARETGKTIKIVTPEYEKHGYKLGKQPTIVSSYDKPVEMSLELPVLRKDAKPQTAPVHTFRFPLMSDDNSMMGEELLEEIEGTLVNWIDKRPGPFSRRLAIIFWVIIIVVLLGVASLYFSGTFS